jgi:hypothetical protein
MKDVEDHVGPLVQQHDVSANDDVGAIGRRRRQLPFEFRREGLNFLLQAWRERPATNELPFQTGRQLISLRKSGRQIRAMLYVPVPHFFPVAIAVVGVSIIAIAITAMSAPVSMPISVALREGEASGHGKRCDYTGTKGSSR